jgi:GNAT superfamily N-acetyltransferase
MNTLLSLSPDQALPLLSRVNANPAVAEEYPLVFGLDASGGVVAIGGDDREPRSACAILERDFLTPQGSVKVGLIGSVATDASWQGKGLATRVLVEAEAALAKRGCPIALLWANDPGFYYSRGYRPIGAEVNVRLCPGLALATADGVRPARDADAEAIHALYAGHASRVERRPEETRALLAIPGMTVLVRERAGAPVAYACLGRGIDLKNVVHEWAGATDDMLALIAALLAPRAAGPDGDLFLMAPRAEAELIGRLQALGCDATIGILGLARVLDRGAFAGLLQRLVGTAGRAEAIPGEPGGVQLTTQKAKGLLNDDMLLGLLFPAFGLDEEIQAFRESFGLTSARFPLELFAWGLDSI